MPEIDHRQLAAYAAAAVVVMLVAARVLGVGGASRAASPSPAPRSVPSIALDRGADAGSMVHVAGAVRRPGVYRLSSGKRVEDAIARAGGSTAKGDPNAINLAAKVADGQQVLVPRRAPTPGSAVGAAAVPGAVAGGSPTTAPVNLNTATAEQLDTLDGVGPATATKILEWRQAHGGFRSVEDLAQVPGIGPKKLAALKPRVQV